MVQTVLTDTGFNRPTLSELVQTIGDRMEAAVGPINREADSATGEFIGSMAEAISISYETAELVWMSRFIQSATGFALDALGQWMGGITRNGRTQTQVNAVIYGTESTILPVGALASAGNYNFSLSAAAVISRASLLDGTLRVSDATQTSYTIRVNGVDFTHTRVTADTASTIASRLSALINASSEYFHSTANGSTIRLTVSNLSQGFPVSATTGITWDSIGSPALFHAVDYGSIAVAVGALSNPVSAISGWTGVSNLVAGSTGADRESDYDFRLRLVNSVGSSNGRATADAIRAALLNNVEGVTLAKVLVNNTMNVDSLGLSPKSILCIVEGGLEQEIGQEIWDYIAGGISTNGSTLVQVVDSSSNPQVVYFSRPGSAGIYVLIVVDELNPEEVLPAEIVSLINAGVGNYFASLGLGDDVIPQRIEQYVMANTTGLARITATVGKTESSLSGDIVVIQQDSFATLVSTRVEGV